MITEASRGGYQLSAISYQLSAISYQLSAGVRHFDHVVSTSSGCARSN
ncbi:MAG TPA: hypothetical protein VFI39_10465 [Gemmatimonadales bacterium]|nr:hypothetical protein [Gemmatimonadales bacterium]